MPTLIHAARRLCRAAAYGLFLLLSVAAMLAAAEGVLRLTGVGESTRFFLERELRGERIDVSNKAYYQQFYSMPVESLVTWDDLEFQVTPDKPADTFRVFIFGGSAANGLPPDTAYSFWRVLRAMLQERFPSIHFEFCNAACPGANSHVMRGAAAACARMHPDLFLVYMGNNEFVGPFGAGSSVASAPLPSLALIRARIALSDLRLLQVLRPQQFHDRALTVVSETDVWRYLTPIDPDGKNPRFVMDNFRSNLADIARSARECGAAAVFSTVAVNLKDWAPIESRHAVGLSEQDLAEWKKHIEEGAKLEDAENSGAAAAEFSAACRIDPAHAEGLFRLGRSLLREGRREEAYKWLSLARDRDWVMGRATTAINGIIRSAAVKSGAILVEGESALSAASPDGIAGREVMYDNVHMNYDGNCALAAAFFPLVEREVCKRMGEGEAEQAVPGRAAIDRRLAMTPYQTLCHVEVMEGIMPKFRKSMPLTWNEDIDWLNERRETLQRESGPEGLNCWLDALELAWKSDPDDYYLGQRRVRGMIDAGHFEEVRGEAEALAERWPALRAPKRLLAQVMAGEGEKAAAVAELRELVAEFPDDSDGWTRLAYSTLDDGRAPDAVALFRRAVSANPSNLGAQAGLARALTQAGCTEEALKAYRETIQMNPADVPPYEAADAVLACPEYGVRRAVFWKDLCQQYPAMPLPAFCLARALQAGNSPKAAEEWKEALELAKDFGGLDLFKGEALEALGEKDAAMDAYQAAMGAKLNDYRGYDRLNAILTEEGDNADREQTWRRIVGELPNAARAWFHLAAACSARGEWGDAVEAASRARAMAPQDPAVAALLGHACLEKGDYSAAVAPLRAALAINPDIVAAREDLARALKAAGGR